jgi:hypothetical protein
MTKPPKCKHLYKIEIRRRRPVLVCMRCERSVG